MWIWLLAIVLIIGTWVGGYFLDWPLWLKILLTGLAVLIVVGWLVFRRFRAVMKARALERELLKQAEEQALNARPDRRAEILELQVQMQRGLQALKQSRIGAAGSQSALYTLPWYMIIGPPGAGKTTALKHSGLVFPALDPRSGGGIRGVGGTRNCDWWFTNEAILLDTAGRYATEADDHDEWMSFIDMLRRYRSRKPINGVLIAISVTDLMEATEEQIDSYAKRLRSRIDEVTARLQMVVPVYVTFTKLDLVAGFVEFWGDLRKSERAQIWGATFPLEGADKREPARAFEEEFDALVERVHQRAMRRLGTERVTEQRQRIYQFPLEFAALKQNLQEFINGLFQQTSFQDAPILRGVYFTSGTQEGRPIDRVIGGMMRAFNLSLPSVSEHDTTHAGEAKSYFVTDLFKRVVFPDQNIASRTRSEQRRQRINRLAFAIAALLLAMLVVAPSTYTFGQNMALVGSVRDAAERAQKVNWNDGNPNFTEKVHRLDDLGAKLDLLEGYRKDGPPWRLGWGMYAGDSLYDPLRQVYVANLERGFAAPTRAELERELSSLSVGGTHLNVEQYGTYFGRLKAYLEMTEPARIEIDPDDPQNKGEPRALTEAWARALGTTQESDKNVLKPHVTRYVQLVQRGEIPPWRANMDLVTRVRSILKQTSETDRDYSALVRDPNENIDPITRSSIFIGSTFATYVTSKSKPEVVVRGAFTKEGWNGYIRDKLDKDRAARLAQDRWVLGETEEVGRGRMEKILKDLTDRYFAEYRNAWADFLRDLDVRQPESNAEALDELQALSEQTWPYSKLLKTMADNTRLEPPPPSLAAQTGNALLQKAEGKVEEKARQNATVNAILGSDGGAAPPPRWVSPVEEAFRPMVDFGVPPAPVGDEKPPEKPPPTQLSQYNGPIVSKVVSTLTDMKDSKVPADPKAVAQTFQDAFRSTSELLTSSQSGFTRPLLSPLLMNPIRLSFAGVLSDVAGAAGGKWELDVWQIWHLKLEDKYPFTNSAQDVSLADYTAFFQPQKGLLWDFYDKYLKESLERDGTSFTPVTRFQHSISYTPDFLKCYERGAEITDDTFPPEAKTPKVEFDVNLHSVSESVAEVTFAIDGAERTYKNWPEEWLHTEWPAKEPKVRGGGIRVRGYDSLDEEISRPGDFGFFRLLDAASSIEKGTEGGKPGGRPTIVVTWTLASQKAWVKMDVKPPQIDSAFSKYLEKKHERVFKDYKCPRIVAAGVR
jgi:type VI secretion system protein ImpL